jgi:hypothetical protein
MMERMSPKKGNQHKIPVLGDFVRDATAMDVGTFSRLHGEAYFLHFGPIDDLHRPIKSEATVMTEIPGTAKQASFNPQADFIVFPFRLQPKDQSRGTLVWVGRGHRNDVVIPDESISAIQAFIRAESDGAFHLQDMRSANGSFVNDKRVPELGMGEPLIFKPGDRIRFGRVSFTFLLAADFHVLVSRLAE